MSNPNDPAYPGMTHVGMTIRQQFVMAAMASLCDGDGLPHVHWVATRACELTDAALAEEARTRSGE